MSSEHRPARRTLGVPGQSRPDEWLESAYGPEEAPYGPEETSRRPAEPGHGAEEAAPARVPAPATGTSEPEPMPDPAPLPEPEPEPEPVPDSPDEHEVPLRAALEAVLMVVDEPAAESHLADVLDRPRAVVAAALRELSAEYTAQGRGFDLRMVAGGWRFYSRADCAGAVDRFVLDGRQARLTQAALETLAVVAYRQPVSRSRVSAVRGVNCDGVMRTLVQRGLVEETGSEPETGAILYRTTNYFLERMGLRGLAELPELAPFLPEVDDVEAESLEGTMIAEAVAAAQEALT
jgi:segregation and condensation protein B